MQNYNFLMVTAIVVFIIVTFGVFKLGGAI